MAVQGQEWKKQVGTWMDGWMDGRKFTEKKKRCRRRLREDAALHPQSSVRLHKYCVHGRVAGSQVNMTYEYCSSHSLPSCPPQLLMCGSELAQVYLRPFSPSLLKNRRETQKDGRGLCCPVL